MEEQKEVIVTKKVVTEAPVQTEHPQQAFETKKSIFRTYQIVWYILGVIETFLIFRVILKVMAADPASGFANFIYSVSLPFVAPFLGVLGISTEPTTGSVFEWFTLIAMIVYWVISYGIVELLQLIKPVTPEEVEQTVDSQ